MTMSIITGFLAYQFAGLWALLWHFGLLGVLAIACFAAAYFSPVFKKDFLWAGIAFVAIFVTLAIGVTLGEKRVQAQWDQAKFNALETGKQARIDGVRDAARAAARKPSRWLPNDKDRFNRDR